jgi:urease accessory protein
MRMRRKPVLGNTRMIIPLMTILLTIIPRAIMASIITITTMTNTPITIMITAIPMLMSTSKPPAAALDIRERMNGSEAAALYRLMTWLSPAFPVGAFSYSSGIEWAVESGDIADADSLRHWLGAMLAEGSGFCDGVFLAQAHSATLSRDDDQLRDIAELAAAFVPSRERHLETSAQGRAFIEIASAAWNSELLEQTIAGCEFSIVYPVAVGLVSAAHAIPLAPTMHAFLHALTSNWISAGARLVPLGQTDSQRVLALLEPAVAVTAARAMNASVDDLGSATFRADLASMRHESQYTRLFRS